MNYITNKFNKLNAHTFSKNEIIQTKKLTLVSSKKVLNDILIYDVYFVFFVDSTHTYTQRLH